MVRSPGSARPTHMHCLNPRSEVLRASKGSNTRSKVLSTRSKALKTSHGSNIKGKGQRQSMRQHHTSTASKVLKASKGTAPPGRVSKSSARLQPPARGPRYSRPARQRNAPRRGSRHSRHSKFPARGARYSKATQDRKAPAIFLSGKALLDKTNGRLPRPLAGPAVAKARYPIRRFGTCCTARHHPQQEVPPATPTASCEHLPAPGLHTRQPSPKKGLPQRIHDKPKLKINLPLQRAATRSNIKTKAPAR
jgi:hypothetical protein